MCYRSYGDSWLTKAEKAFHYHQVFGTEMWTMTTANRLTAASLAATQDEIDPRLSYAWYATALYGFQGFGWTEPYFSATGAAQNYLPWRARPSPNLPAGTGAEFLNDVQHLGDLHTRDTDVGQFRLICSASGTRSAAFVANASISNTPTATSSPSATASLTATRSPTPTASQTPTPTPSRMPLTRTPTAPPPARPRLRQHQAERHRRWRQPHRPRRCQVMWILMAMACRTTTNCNSHAWTRVRRRWCECGQ